MIPRIQMLGRFDVDLGSEAESVVLPRQKAMALLALLASPIGTFRSRCELADLLWRGFGEPAARNNLRQSLFVIRKSLPEFSGLLVTPDGIALERSSVNTDVQEFEKKSSGKSVQHWESALELYSGNFLEGLAVHECGFEDWRARESERLVNVCLSVCERLMASHLDRGCHTDAIRVANHSLRLDPFHEIAHETLVVSNAALGRLDLARKHYESFSNLVSTELGIAPHKPLHVLLSKGQEARSAPQGPENSIEAPAIGASISNSPIAIVLPFESTGRESALSAEALAAKLIGDLGDLLPMPVVGQSSFFYSDNRVPSVAKMATDFGVRYSVQGGIRSRGGYWRVEYRLVDLRAGLQLLSGSRELRSDHPFEASDSFAAHIAAESANSIELHERRRMSLERSKPVDIWERCCLGMALLDQVDCNSVIQAQIEFREALELAPGSARVLAGLSQTVLQEGICLVGRSRKETYAESLELAHSAHTLERNDPFVNWSLGKAYQRLERFSDALEAMQRALHAAPGNPDVCGSLGNLLSFMGMPEKGIPLIRLSLNSTDAYLAPLARSYLQMGNYENALSWSKTAIEVHPNNSGAYVILGSALGHLGRKGDAVQALQKCEATHRGRVKAEFEVLPTQYKNPKYHDHVLDGIGRAGWRA